MTNDRVSFSGVKRVPTMYDYNSERPILKGPITITTHNPIRRLCIPLTIDLIGGLGILNLFNDCCLIHQL